MEVGVLFLCASHIIKNINIIAVRSTFLNLSPEEVAFFIWRELKGKPYVYNGVTDRLVCIVLRTLGEVISLKHLKDYSNALLMSACLSSSKED